MPASVIAPTASQRIGPAIWRYRGFIVRSALAELRHRFSGSVAGYLWNVFVPLAQLIVFAIIFSVLMGNRMPADSPVTGRFSFIVFLCSGLLPWNAFAETLARSAGAMVSAAGFIKKLPIPEQIFVATENVGGIITGLIALAIFAVFSIFVADYGPYLQWLQALGMLVLFMWFGYGLGLILACLNAFFRDIQPFMNVILLLWMWLTPIVYLDTFFQNSQHDWMLTLFRFNPAYYFIDGFHEALFWSRWIQSEHWLTCLAIAAGTHLLALPVLARLRGEIRDVL